MIGQVNWAQQPQGDPFGEAFKKGYGLMDSLYQSVRQNQVRSKLAEMYVANPDEDPTTRMRKAVPLLAMYGDPNKAIELESTIEQREINNLYKQQMMQNSMNKSQTGKTYFKGGSIYQTNPDDGSVSVVGQYDEPEKSYAPKWIPGKARGSATFTWHVDGKDTGLEVPLDIMKKLTFTNGELTTDNSIIPTAPTAPPKGEKRVKIKRAGQVGTILEKDIKPGDIRL